MTVQTLERLRCAKPDDTFNVDGSEIIAVRMPFPTTETDTCTACPIERSDCMASRLWEDCCNNEIVFRATALLTARQDSEEEHA